MTRYSLFLIMLVLAALLTAPAARGDELRNVKIGQPVPDFVLATVDGGKVSLADLKGRTVILAYVSAKQRSSEAATLDAQTVFRSMNREDVSLVFVTADAGEAVYFRQHRDRTKVHEPLGLDFDRDLYGGLGLIVMPTTIVIDGEGKLAHVIAAYKSDYEHVLGAYVKHTLGIIDDEQLKSQLEAHSFQRDRPKDRIARHRAAAGLLRKNGLSGDAENELKSALKIDANHVDTLLDLASLYVTTDRVTEALNIVSGVLKDKPKNRRAKLVYGIVLYHADRLDEAEKILREALVLNPDPVQTYYHLGMIYEKRGEMDKAAEHYREALSRLLKDQSF